MRTLARNSPGGACSKAGRSGLSASGIAAAASATLTVPGARADRPTSRGGIGASTRDGQNDRLTAFVHQAARDEARQRAAQHGPEREPGGVHQTACGQPSLPQVTLLMNSTGAPLFCAS